MQALIFEGQVVQIEAAEFPVASTFEWVDLTGIVPAPEVGWSYDDAVFAAPPPLPLADVKRAKRQEFIGETIVRMAAQVPAWNSFERIDFLVSIANLLDTAALTAAQTLARDIFLFTRNTAIPKINAFTTQAKVSAVDPTNPDPFGDGTLWPA